MSDRDEFLARLGGFDSPYLGKFSLNSKVDDFVPGENGLAPLRLCSNIVTPVDKIFFQVVKVKNPAGEAAYIRRFVGILENGNEVDISEPTALDADIVEMGVDTSRCAACGLKLDPVDTEFFDGEAYHRYCLAECK